MHRVLVVYKFGGLYMDTDVLTLKANPTDSKFHNVVFDQGGDYANGAILRFSRGHPFLQLALQTLVCMKLHPLNSLETEM